MDDMVSRGVIVALISGIGIWLVLKPAHATPALTPSASLRGKTIIVTGANSGVGFAAVKAFASRGARVTLACRDVEKGENAARSIRSYFNNASVSVEYLDLSKPESIRSFASSVKQCHVLVNNAGLMNAQPCFHEGIELTMLTNHLGPFMLTELLLPVLKRTAVSQKTECRVINVASRLEKVAKVADNWLTQGPQPFNPFTAYANSKLCNLLSTFELSRRLRRERNVDVVVNAMTPGMVRTNLSRFAPWWQRALYFPFSLLLRHPDKGAETVVFMAEAESLKGVSGKYFFDCREIESSVTAQSEVLAAEVWAESCRLMDVRDEHALKVSHTSRSKEESEKLIDESYQ